MSPEPLDPRRFNYNGCLTRRPDHYALGMVIYEVRFLYLALRTFVPHSPSLVLTGHLPSYNLRVYSIVEVVVTDVQCLETLHTESLLRHGLGVCTAVQERFELDSKNCPAAI